MEGRAAIERDWDRLEKCAAGTLKFGTGKHKVLHMGWNNSTQQDRLRAGCTGEGFAEKDLRVLVDDSNMPLLQSQLHPGLH